MRELDPTLTMPSNIEGAIVRKPEILEHPFRIDAFIIHGKNWVEYPPGRFKRLKTQLSLRAKNLIREAHHEEPEKAKKFHLKLSRDSRITALATGMLWEHFAELQPDNPPILIFSTGKTAGKDWPSEAQAMVDYMMVRFGKNPEIAKKLRRCIVLEDNSYDTPGNVTESKRILEGKDLSPELQEKLTGRRLTNLAYLTIGYHNPRVARLMDYYDVPISVIFPTEQIARRRSRRHEEFIRQYLEPDQPTDPKMPKKPNLWKKQVFREDILNAEMLLDPGQKLLSRFVTNRVRHQ